MNRFGNMVKPQMWFFSLLLATLTAGCGSDGDGGISLADNAANGGVCSGAGCVPLGAAGTFAILSQAGISTVPASAVTGNIGVSPIDRTGLTAFSETMDASNTFSRSVQVTGKLYAADYAPPTPSNLTTAIADMNTAYINARDRPAGVGPNLNLGGGTLTSQTLAPGTYTWGTAVNIPTDLTFSGLDTDVWILQISGTLTQAPAMSMILAGGAKSSNIFWQVTSSVSIGAGAHFEGILMSATDINLLTGTTANGRLYAGTAVALQQTALTRP